MLTLWRKWIAYPVGWLVIVGVVLAGIAYAANSGRRTYSPMESFAASYVAERHGDGVRLLVTESITDKLDPYRKGITRTIPTTYDGQDLGLHSFSVEDPSGERLRFRQRAEPNGDVSLAIDRPDMEMDYDPDVPLEVPVTFNVSYVIDRPVVDGDGFQELYFNVNGTGWSNGFRQLSAELQIDDDLAGRLTGDAACYWGEAGEDNPCELTREGNTFSAGLANVAPYSNMTLAVAFEPGIAADPLQPLKARSHGWWGIAGLVGIGLAAVLLALGVRAWVRRPDSSEVGIVTEFTPPHGITPMQAADFLGVPERGAAAHLAWLVAEGHGTLTTDNLTPVEPGPEGASLPPHKRRLAGEQLTLNWTDPGLKTGRRRLSWDDTEVTELLFGRAGSDNSLLNGRYSSTLDEAQVKRDEQVERLGLRRRLSIGATTLTLGYLALIGYGLYQVWVGLDGLGLWFLIGGVVGVLLLLYATHLMPVHGRLTEKGRTMQRRLAGLERFVMASEAQRISWMNNAQSAPVDDEGRVQLYEKLLPWAIVFGGERSWRQVLGDMYSRFPQRQVRLPSWQALTEPMRWASPDVDHYRSRRTNRLDGFWGERPSFGEGSITNGMKSFGEFVGEAARGMNSSSGSTRSFGRGWGGGGGSRGGGSRGGGSFGGGRSGGGIGGGGGGRR